VHLEISHLFSEKKNG